MLETSRAASRSASTRLSARSRSYLPTTLDSTKRYSGTRRATSSRTAASPFLIRRSQGSIPDGLDGDVGLRDEVLVAAEGAQRGLLAGGVAVEGEDHLAAELLVVVEEAAQHPGVLVAEGGAAGGHGGADPGQVAGHHVGVALDDHGLRGAGDLAPGQVDAVEHLALLVDRRLGGVEVLRLDPVVVEDPARPEADGVAAGVADRPEQAAAEAVVRRAADRHQPADDELLLAERLLAQVLEQRLALARGEADAELLGRGLVEAPLGEELPGRPGRRAWPAGRRRTPGPPGAPRSTAGALAPWDGPRGRHPPRAAAARRTCRRAARRTRRT